MKASILRKRLEAGKVVSLGEGEDVVHVWPDTLASRNKRVYIMKYSDYHEHDVDGLYFYNLDSLIACLEEQGLVEDDL